MRQSYIEAIASGRKLPLRPNDNPLPCSPQEWLGEFAYLNGPLAVLYDLHSCLVGSYEDDLDLSKVRSSIEVLRQSVVRCSRLLDSDQVCEKIRQLHDGDDPRREKCAHEVLLEIGRRAHEWIKEHIKAKKLETHEREWSINDKRIRVLNQWRQWLPKIHDIIWNHYNLYWDVVDEVSGLPPDWPRKEVYDPPFLGLLVDYEQMSVTRIGHEDRDPISLSSKPALWMAFLVLREAEDKPGNADWSAYEKQFERSGLRNVISQLRSELIGLGIGIFNSDWHLIENFSGN